MRMIIIALAAGVVLTGCVSGSGSQTRPPNYASTQAHQEPAIRNDTFGGAAMPMRGLPHQSVNHATSGRRSVQARRGHLLTV
ncbi:hypothetical protein [Microvirga tunisiensis]|uniref:hypothetical protein n=1 Tax=Microvirga tunisiensis TaxID=2108360 RepID=UPI00128D48B3|nr:hypothetical protein [Microvirga tunisiensis]MPR12423.1 hypothetical protein [Microvirga tunisiensis]